MGMLKIDEENHKRLKIEAANHGLTINDTLTKILDKEL